MEFAISQNYTCPRMREMVRKKINQCGCKAYKKEKRQNRRKMKRRNQKFAKLTFFRIDCIGRFPKSQKGNKYIISARCETTKLCVLEAVPNIQAITVWVFIRNRLIRPFGNIKILGSDNGPEFRNGLLTGLSQNLQFNHEFITAGRSQGTIFSILIFFCITYFAFSYFELQKAIFFFFCFCCSEWRYRTSK